MSILETQSLPCPACGEASPFEVAHSVLADRRPDLRAAILANRFQVETCESCGARYRREPDLNYLDIGRGQWILVRPAAEVSDWPDLEAQAQGIFELGYGVLAPEPAQEIGRGLAVRVAFGWPALREKLLAREAELDDAVLECLKLNLIRTLDGPSLGDTVELRLVAADEFALTLAWIDAVDEARIEMMTVPRDAYDQLAEAGEAYKDLRALLTEGPFVDMNRMLIDPADR
ncbi:MAG TPA: CpXC domain-containing protein, partial [Sphingomicrobium sp.]|nr:CpXC domain-containing protein [Sphingomicrobium sp.]